MGTSPLSYLCTDDKSYSATLVDILMARACATHDILKNMEEYSLVCHGATESIL